MDIQIASNFERYLYYYFGEDSEALAQFMQDFQSTGSAKLPGVPDDATFSAQAIDNDSTLAAIKQAYDEYGYVLDPHTAVGYAACQSAGLHKATLIATAHPAKFPEAISQVLDDSPTHPTLQALAGLASRRAVIEADLEAVKALFN